MSQCMQHCPVVSLIIDNLQSRLYVHCACTCGQQLGVSALTSLLQMFFGNLLVSNSFCYHYDCTYSLRDAF